MVAERYQSDIVTGVSHRTKACSEILNCCSFLLISHSQYFSLSNFCVAISIVSQFKYWSREMSPHDTSRAHAIVVTCIVAPIITSLFVLIRVWTRTFVSRSAGWDDCLAAPFFPPSDSADKKIQIWRSSL